MDCNELSLREMLTSVHGPVIGRCILDQVEAGTVVTIVTPDGSHIHLTAKDQALRVLMDRFGWRPA
ncbi:MAG TPA: hypothetical protein VLE43_19920 [Candidatus Saccharimonadia bacterium]|nr:hypothetical protein [Candidatus Saccharimonadia bacterium]